MQGLPRKRVEQGGVGGELIELVGQGRAPEIEELGPEETNAVGRVQHPVAYRTGVVDVQHHLDALARRGHGRACEQGGFLGDVASRRSSSRRA